MTCCILTKPSGAPSSSTSFHVTPLSYCTPGRCAYVISWSSHYPDTSIVKSVIVSRIDKTGDRMEVTAKDDLFPQMDLL
jgi:hypothetical protein